MYSYINVCNIFIIGLGSVKFGSKLKKSTYVNIWVCVWVFNIGSGSGSLKPQPNQLVGNIILACIGPYRWLYL